MMSTSELCYFNQYAVSNSAALLQKLCTCCDVFRDDRLSLGGGIAEWRLSVAEELGAVVSAKLRALAGLGSRFSNGRLLEQNRKSYEARTNASKELPVL
jgi:hypothetical protein